jgi:hypothetical protein
VFVSGLGRRLGGSAADLVLSGAYTRPDERIWPEIALNVGRDDLSRDAIAWHKPLICARHCDCEVFRRAGKRKTGLMSVPGKGQGGRGAKRDKEGRSRLQDKTPEAEASARMEMNRSCSVWWLQMSGVFPEGRAKAGAAGKSGDPNQYSGTWEWACDRENAHTGVWLRRSSLGYRGLG